MTNESNPFDPNTQEQRLAADVQHDYRISTLRKQLSAGLLMAALGGAGFAIGVTEAWFSDANTDSRPEAIAKVIGGIAGGGFAATLGGLTIYDARRRLEVYGE